MIYTDELQTCTTRTDLLVTFPVHGDHGRRASLPMFTLSRSLELRTQKLKPHLVKIQSLNVLPLKPVVAVPATLTANDFFLAYLYPSALFTCIFSKTSPSFSCVGPQNEVGRPG